MDLQEKSRLYADRRLFTALQRGKGLEGFAVFDDHYLLSVDGTGVFSSHDIHCDPCCEKHHRNGQVTYYHHVLGAVLVHPNQREVFPLTPEPILKQDGQKKNDCERNAAKRLLSDLRRDHPHLKLIVVEFDWVDTSEATQTWACTDEQGVTHRFRYHNAVPLNDKHFDLEVNFLDYWEEKPKGKNNTLVG